MSTTAAIVFCVGVFGSIAFATQGSQGSPISLNLKLIVTVEGKSFFADTPRLWNWTEAGEYCVSLGMKLADITSKGQYDGLKAAFESGVYDTEAYWTAGRDAHLPRQFSWNTTGDAISSDYGEIRKSNSLPYQTCVFFFSRPDNDSSFYYYACSEKFAVLCST